MPISSLYGATRGVGRRVKRDPLPLVWIFAPVFILALAVWIVFFPSFQRSATPESEWRGILVQVLVGVAIFVGAIYAAKQVHIAQDAKTTAEYTRAVDQLASEHMAARLGGVYALGRIAKDSERDHWTIMQVLTAFVREGSRRDRAEATAAAQAKCGEPLTALQKARALADIRSREDFRAVAEVLREREHEREARWTRLDLEGANLREADLVETNLERAFLRGANLEWAKLARAHLEGANLLGADVVGADLNCAHLESTDLREAHLERVDLSGAYLEDADLTRAHLEGANLIDAHLEGADLTRAHLEGANLLTADVVGADLTQAHLERANLIEAHLEGADLSGAHLEGANLSGATHDALTVWAAVTYDADTKWPEGSPPEGVSG